MLTKYKMEQLRYLLGSLSIKDLKNLVRYHNLHYFIRVRQPKEALINLLLQLYSGMTPDQKFLTATPYDLPYHQYAENPSTRTRRKVKKVQPAEPLVMRIAEQPLQQAENIPRLEDIDITGFQQIPQQETPEEEYNRRMEEAAEDERKLVEKLVDKQTAKSSKKQLKKRVALSGVYPPGELDYDEDAIYIRNDIDKYIKEIEKLKDPNTRNIKQLLSHVVPLYTEAAETPQIMNQYNINFSDTVRKAFETALDNPTFAQRVKYLKKYKKPLKKPLKL